MEKVSCPGIKLPLQQADVLQLFPWSLSEASSLCSPISPDLSRPAAQTQAAGHHTGWDLETGLGKQVGNSPGRGPSDLPQPRSQPGHLHHQDQTRAPPISEMTQDPPCSPLTYHCYRLSEQPASHAGVGPTPA